MVRRILVVGTMLAIVIAVSASAASSGLYSGETSQKLKITVKVSRGKVVRFDYIARYGSCGEFTGADKLNVAIKRSKFSVIVHPNSETSDKLNGRFNGKNLKGTLTSSVTTGGIHPTTCTSGNVRFSAKL